MSKVDNWTFCWTYCNELAPEARGGCFVVRRRLTDPEQCKFHSTTNHTSQRHTNALHCLIENMCLVNVHVWEAVCVAAQADYVFYVQAWLEHVCAHLQGRSDANEAPRCSSLSWFFLFIFFFPLTFGESELGEMKMSHLWISYTVGLALEDGCTLASIALLFMKWWGRHVERRSRNHWKLKLSSLVLSWKCMLSATTNFVVDEYRIIYFLHRNKAEVQCFHLIQLSRDQVSHTSILSELSCRTVHSFVSSSSAPLHPHASASVCCQNKRFSSMYTRFVACLPRSAGFGTS